MKTSPLVAMAAVAVAQDCPFYTDYSSVPHEPYSEGQYRLPSQRLPQECRTYEVPKIEQTIVDMEETIADPDLYRLFANTWPNTADTTVLWNGFSADNAEEEVRPFLSY